MKTKKIFRATYLVVAIAFVTLSAIMEIYSKVEELDELLTQ